MKTGVLFCAKCNKEMEHTFTAINGEHYATDSEGHFVKFPAKNEDGSFATKEQIESWVKLHNQHNSPKVTAEQVASEQAELEAILLSLDL